MWNIQDCVADGVNVSSGTNGTYTLFIIYKKNMQMSCMNVINARARHVEIDLKAICASYQLLKQCSVDSEGVALSREWLLCSLSSLLNAICFGKALKLLMVFFIGQIILAFGNSKTFKVLGNTNLKTTESGMKN